MARPSVTPLRKVLGFACGLGLGLLPVFLLPMRPAQLPQSVVRRSAPFDFNAPPHYKDKQVFRIVALGSSSTKGTGATSAANTYPSRVERLLNDRPGGKEPVAVVNRGIGGEAIPDMMKRLQSDILSRKPDLVIWQTGSNDALQQVSVETFKDGLRDGVTTIRQSGAEVMLMEPQWCRQIERAEPARRYLQAMQEVAEELAVSVIPRFELMQQWIATGLVSENELIGPDHLHMTDRGYALLAQTVFEQVLAHSATYRRDVRGEASAARGAMPTLR